MTLSESNTSSDKAIETDVNGVSADKESTKYKIALKLVNCFLINRGKQKITELTEFINIDRDDVIQNDNLLSLRSMEDEIFAHYSKTKCNYYRKSSNTIMNCLRGMLRDLNHKIVFSKKDISESINEKVYRRTHVFYTILRNT